MTDPVPRPATEQSPDTARGRVPEPRPPRDSEPPRPPEGPGPSPAGTPDRPERDPRRLVFGDLDDYPVMAQALDNQWLPAPLASARQHASAPARPPVEAVEAASAELRRSLVNSGTLVVNRAFFLNNEALYSNYLPSADPVERDAFVRLLNDRVIVPYLYTERDAASDFSWAHDRAVGHAWRRLVTEEADPALVRFDWDDESNRGKAGQIGNFFSSHLSLLRRLRAKQLAQDLGIPEELARSMREGVLKDMYFWAGEQDNDRDITRNAVYERFITRPGTDPYQNLLRDGDHVVPTKQLVDLLYSLGVPRAGGVIPLTPPDSPPRSTLQELRTDLRPRDDDPEAIGRLLRDLFADVLHRAVDGPNSYAGLSLADIGRLRREEEWRAYVDSLDSFVRGGAFDHGRLPSPEEFAAGTSEVARRHARMLKAARATSSAAGGGYTRDIVTALVVEAGGVALQITSGEEVSLMAGVVQGLTAAAGALTIRLEFFDRGAKGRRGGLGHSLTLPTLRLGNLKRDWKAIVGAYGGQVVETGLPVGSLRQADQQRQPD
ncbi:hypothetical protein [Streptomyces sp. TLI_105]|uniref:hypothetical protein n=1 Tax=Streptomyces sp. TLI_105 TaxID=1881019 RepID=UPI00089B23E7|nr:hypothetical protein [Streptomyces sp. TLI_105]SEC86662.1 hypothetical protein SAMN05428939_3490 [Streptomyces sp. TLI_105]